MQLVGTCGMFVIKGDTAGHLDTHQGAADLTSRMSFLSTRLWVIISSRSGHSSSKNLEYKYIQKESWWKNEDR